MQHPRLTGWHKGLLKLLLYGMAVLPLASCEPVVSGRILGAQKLGLWVDAPLFSSGYFNDVILVSFRM